MFILDLICQFQLGMLCVCVLGGVALLYGSYMLEGGGKEDRFGYILGNEVVHFHLQFQFLILQFFT